MFSSWYVQPMQEFTWFGKCSPSAVWPANFGPNQLPSSLCSSNTNSLSVVRARTAFASHSFSVAAPQFGTHYLLTSALVHDQTPSVVCLKPTVSSRPSVPSSCSHTCLRFSHWLTLCTTKDFTHLLRWLGGIVTRTLNLQSKAHEYDSWPGLYQAVTYYMDG